MLSLPQQGFPVTCRSGHCCVCSPLLFASDILCNSPTVNREWIQLAQGPVTRNVALQIFESASPLVCKSAGLRLSHIDVSLICCPNLSPGLRLSHTDVSRVQLLTHDNVAHLLPKLACIIVQISENYSSTFFVEKLFDPPEKSPNVPSV